MATTTEREGKGVEILGLGCGLLQGRRKEEETTFPFP